MSIERSGRHYAIFDGMCWPIPSELGDIEWKLRYSEPDKTTRLVAASVVAAYRELLGATIKHREGVVSKIKQVEL